MPLLNGLLKQCRPRSDASEGGVCSGSEVFSAEPWALCCVPEQGMVSSESTDVTKKTHLHDWKFVDWDIKNQLKIVLTVK